MALAAAEGSPGLALTVADAYFRRNDGSSGPHLPEVPRVGGVQDPQEKRQDGREREQFFPTDAGTCCSLMGGYTRRRLEEA